jgi:hypothetical protein
MPDQNRRAILPRQHALCRSDRFRQRRERVLHGGGIESRRLQSRDHVGPARAVGEQPMHKHHVARLRRGCGHGAWHDQRSRGSGNHAGGKSPSVHRHDFSSFVGRDIRQD